MHVEQHLDGLARALHVVGLQHFDERLLELGLHRTLALRLFEKRHPTLVQAARLAGLSAEGFVVLLGETGIPAADHPADELDEEVGTAS